LQPVLGIIAGGGNITRRLIRHCVEAKITFHILAVKGHADAADVEPYPHTWVRFGEGKKIFDTLKTQHVTDLVMIGHMRRPSLLQLRPDWVMLKLLPKLGLAWLGDDGLLRNVIKIFENLGVRVRGIHEYLPRLLAPVGVLTDAQPTEADNIDMEKGIAAAMKLGFDDIGQAVAARDGDVIARETRSGTDAMLNKIAKLKGKGGVLVKLCKPQQDKRVDLPTIGSRTVENVAWAGLRGVAISAGCTLIDDIDATVQLANRLGIFIIGVEP